MALNIGASGIIRPYVKYNAKSDKWFIRAEGGGDLEIARPTFLLDLANIRTGWLRFQEGQAPERLIDPALDKVAPTPGEGFKRGFVVMAFSPKFFGGAVEMAWASIHVSNAIRDSQAWTVGALVYWDDTNKRCTTVATANLLIGVAAAAVAGGAGNTTGRVRLNASFRANDP